MSVVARSMTSFDAKRWPGRVRAIATAISIALSRRVRVRHDTVRETDAARFLGIDGASGEDQLLGDGAPTSAGSWLAPTDETVARADEAELRVVRADADVAVDREDRATAVGVAVDRRNRRLLNLAAALSAARAALSFVPRPSVPRRAIASAMSAPAQNAFSPRRSGRSRERRHLPQARRGTRSAPRDISALMALCFSGRLSRMIATCRRASRMIA